MNEDFSIAPREVELLWGFTQRKVMWAIWQDKVKARQSLVSPQWFVSYNSCVALWGEPIATALLDEIKACHHV